MSSETFTPEDGSVENISFGDILGGLKSVLNKVRLPGQPEIRYAPDELNLPAGVEASEHWDKLAAAVSEARVHAQALLADWDQQQHVAEAIAQAQGENGPQGSLKNPIEL